MGGFASSRILEVHAERMLNGTFNPGFKIKLHQKDLNLALSSAKALGLSLPNTAIAQQMFSVLHRAWRGGTGPLGADHGDRRAGGAFRFAEAK